MLRIESGMHTAVIRRIGTDAENRYLVTASNDKTVGVWEMPPAGAFPETPVRLIRILRPPIGEGNEGKIDAVAISPDGSTVAAGGWTGWDWDGSAYIYLFDRSTGKLTKRIKGLSNVILHLAYSKDGRFLVACLGDNNGIRLYRTSDYTLIGEDRDYGVNSLGADFDASGRLVTVSWDGYIRLYEAGANGRSPLRLIAKEKGRGGNRPYSVSFSPSSSASESKVAVGYDDSPKVDVLSGRDLSYLYSPDTTGVSRGLVAVTWSSDGRSLYAGGYIKDGQTPIFKWPDQGRGFPKELKGADNTILHLIPLKNGGIAFGAYDPAFGIINAADQRTVLKTAYIADYRSMLENFLISYDGFTIKFGYEYGGKSPAFFSVKERLLTHEPSAVSYQLSPPILRLSGIEITDWKDSATPKLNGRALKLNQYEVSFGLAISPDGQSFLLGTHMSLRLFDRSGAEKWNVPVPGIAWSVNISGNGRVAVAAFADGTIRWYRIADGRELLAFFPHKDRKRWVIWSPKGYYDASAGAEELIGWHVNQGKDREADFFPASRFRSGFYRPDVIARVLEVGSEEEALRLANEESGRKREELTVRQQLPPVVSIISPSDNSQIQSTEITIRYTVRTPSGEPVTGIKALVDGRPVSSERGVTIKPKEGEASELRIAVPERNAEVSLIAENRYSASEPSTIRLRWAGQKKEEYVIQPKLYVLSIGVSVYQDKDLQLKYPSKDAKDFAEAMKSQKGILYREVVTKVLSDGMATKEEILDGLDWLQKETTSKDVAMVFIAGHGINDTSGVYYYLPANANLEKLKRTGVAFSDIKNTVASLAGKTVLFVDTCHSGNVMGPRRGVTDINVVVNELASAENGAVVFASSTGKQYSLENDKWNNGAFTKALVEGINGKADLMGKGKITVNMLDAYIAERVKELTGGKQTPTTTKPNTVPDFPIAVKR
jgi:WD40 repeat protein